MLPIAAGVAAALVIAGGAFLVFGGSDEQADRGAAAEASRAKPRGANNTKEDKARKKRQRQREKQRRKREQIQRALKPDWVNDPGRSWAGVLPSGPGWGALMGLGNKNTEFEPRYETRINGPGHEFVVIHTTPVTDPTADENNYTINEKLRKGSSVPARSMARADMIFFKDGPDECEPVNCAKVLMSDGKGGGIAIVAGSQSSQTARTIVKQFALRVEPRY